MNVEQKYDIALKKATDQISQVADKIVRELNIEDGELFIVGGFVRDVFLSQLFNVSNKSKDVDIILPIKPDLTNNPNIVWQKQNSFGGIKVKTKSSQEIDIFQQNVSSPQDIVSQRFDFNCNAIYYSHKQKQIYPSAYFDCFLYDGILDIENVVYDTKNNSIKTIYSVESCISRALRFQILFREKYGFETRLSDNLLWLIFNSDNNMERALNKYNQKIKSIKLRHQIINGFKRYRD